MSKKLSQAELQKIWDISLLTCWKIDASGWAIASGFLKKIESDSDAARKFYEGTKLTPADFEAIRTEIASYQLSRCLDRRTESELEFRPAYTARAFVAEHCERLGTCLWSGKHTNEALLENIDNFKWRRKGKAVANAARMKHYHKQNTLIPVPISARELDKRHDWKTVK